MTGRRPGGARCGAGRLADASRAGRGRGRAAHRGHRAARVAPHRQPAPRPLRPPGRSGLEPVLSVARRQPDADLRRSEPHQALAADRRHEGRRGHREQDALAPDRARTAQGRSLQLRSAQEPARVRRRRQRPAQGHLPAAHRAHGGGGHRRFRRRDPRRGRRCHHRRVTCRARASRRSGICRRWRPPSSASSRSSVDPQGVAGGGQGADQRGPARAARQARSRPPINARSSRSGRRSCGTSRRR